MLPLLSTDPREIGPYRLVGRLGAGGMGVVFAGVDDAGRRVAVKLVHEALSVDIEFRRRFSREVAVLREVDGVCVASVRDADTGTERPWLATEYVPGPTLEERLRRDGVLDPDGLHGLAAGLAEALVALHAAGVVHRDLKPSNVILSPDGPRLIDFGIAKTLDDTSMMTRTGQLVGSPGWISPEEYGDGPSGTPADVYGWGLLVLYAATGEQPYGTGRPEVLALRVREQRLDVSAVPEGLRDLVGRALAKDPEQRPTAAEALAGAMEAWPGRAEEPERPADVTSLLQRTWVMPVTDLPDWNAPSEAGEPGGNAPDALAVPKGDALAVNRPGVNAGVPGGNARGWTAPTGPRTAPVPLPPPVGARPPAPPVYRRPSWVLAYIATAVAVTLIAVTAIIAFTGRQPAPIAQQPAAQQAQVTPTVAGTAAPPVTTTFPPPVTTTAPPPTVTVTSTATPARGGNTVSFKGIKLPLPQGWRLIRVRSDLACIESPRAKGSSGPWDFACRPDAMAVKTGSGTDDWPGNAIEDERWGWYLGTPMPCLRGGRVWRDPNGAYDESFGEYGLYEGAYGGGAILEKTGLTRMGDGRKAFHRQWWIPCSFHGEYRMKVWHLPQSKVSFFVLAARDDDARGHRRIIAGADLTGYKHAAPA